MAEMIERVATALMQALKAELDGHPIPGDVAPDTWTATGGSINMEVLARVAMEAMREPTDEMVRAGQKSAYQAPRNAYMAMIDEAMK